MKQLVSIPYMLTLLLWATTAQASMLNQDVTDAAIRHGLPPRLMDALHQRECSRRVVCPMGAHREWGPFQVRTITAIEAGCTSYQWWIMPGNADCAARVLIMKGARPGKYLRALAGYNGCPKPKGVKRPCRSNWYAHRVYHMWLRAEMARRGDQLLAAR